jgi:hypothetical protein
MQISDGFSGATEPFSKSPFQEPAFLVSSLLFVGATGFGIYVLTEYWTRLRGSTCAWLILITVGLVGFWSRSILEYHRMRQLRKRDVISDVPSDSTLGATISIAERMFNSGLFFTFFISWVLLAQILNILQQQ